MELDRDKVTFAQAEGKAPLPQPLALYEISKEARALLWAAIHTSIKRHFHHPSMGGHATIRDPWHAVLLREHVNRLHLPIDEFAPRAYPQVDRIKAIVLNSTYWEVLNWIQEVLRDRERPYGFDRAIAQALSHSKMAYRLSDDTRTILPAATKEEGDAIVAALEAARTAGLLGVYTHLQNAAEELQGGNALDSCRESIHAVESAARLISPEAAKMLGPALAKLEKSGAIHPALKQAFEKLYGYTNDEKGIRHAQLNDPSNVTDHEAVFMLGACASFVTYLINRAREAGVLNSPANS